MRLPPWADLESVLPDSRVGLSRPREFGMDANARGWCTVLYSTSAQYHSVLALQGRSSSAVDQVWLYRSQPCWLACRCQLPASC